MDKRAANNLVGYVLLFAIALTSLTVVGTVGVDSLEQARDDTVQRNAEQSMLELSGTLDDLHRENVTRRQSQMRLSQGSLQTGAETDIRVDVNGDASYEVDETVRSIVYEGSDVRIVYVAGAVFRIQDDGGATVLREPAFRLEDDGTIVPLVVTSSDTASAGGATTQVIMTRTDGELHHESSVSGDVEVEITPPNDRQAELWEGVFHDEFDGGCGMSSGVTTCRQPVSGDPVVVRTSDVEFQFSA